VLESLETVKILARQQVYAALINARFAKPIDEELIRRLLYNKRVVVTVEEHALAGGFGSAVVDFLSDIGYQGKVLRVGVPDLFVEHGSRKELFELLGMNPAAMAERILDCIHEKSETRTYRRGWASVRDQEVF
jgi:1-deoxy-D-xylulose-5-phosphate synthase